MPDSRVTKIIGRVETLERSGDPRLVAFCGLYCGECGSHKRGRCPGCADNTKASWCAVRTCCLSEKRDSCAACPHHPDPKSCGKFHNWISRIFGFIFRSDRAACIRRIRQVGRATFAKEMAETGQQTLKRR